MEKPMTGFMQHKEADGGLLSCPLCGKAGQIKVVSGRDNSYLPRCSDGLCVLHEIHTTWFGYTYEEAVRVWNTRPTPQPEGAVEGLHPAVIAYAQTMQYKLEKNAHKACPEMNPEGSGVRGWDDCSIPWLIKRACEELDELYEAWSDGRYEDAKKEAADVGNFGMMAHDNICAILRGLAEDKQALAKLEGA